MCWVNQEDYIIAFHMNFPNVKGDSSQKKLFEENNIISVKFVFII